MIWIGIIVLVITLIVVALLCWCDIDSAPYLLYGAICVLALFVSISLILEHFSPYPTALDVYRGKTTLEITYRDSVAVDSTVVYKVR